MGKKYVIEVGDRPLRDACDIELWKVENLNCYISKSELEKLEEYKEAKEAIHEFKVGDVCYMPEGHGDKKLIVTKIRPYITNYMQSDGTLYSWLTEEFTKKAIFVYHSDLFEDFLKGDFT